MTMEVQHFYDEDTCSLSYIVYDQISKDSVVIDPVLNYNHAKGEVDTLSVDTILNFIKSEGLIVHYILETHIHADHMSGAGELKKRLPKAQIGISSNIKKVQDVFARKLHIDIISDSFDTLLSEKSSLEAGSFSVKVIETPGHTPACITYKVGEFLFTGDTLFMPDSGTGRCDFPMGSAEALYDSIMNKIYSLPDSFYIFTGHDYKPNGRKLMFTTTVGESKKENIHIKAITKKEDFIDFRQSRDKKLASPKLLIPSLQVNINGGSLLQDESGNDYLKILISKKPTP